jgi:hypothetical protein
MTIIFLIREKYPLKFEKRKKEKKKKKEAKNFKRRLGATP